jgi:hypothetical protein
MAVFMRLRNESLSNNPVPISAYRSYVARCPIDFKNENSETEAQPTWMIPGLHGASKRILCFDLSCNLSCKSVKYNRDERVVELVRQRSRVGRRS